MNDVSEKKFERLSPEQRKAEIREAARSLFLEKGYGATAMENIADRTTLSKARVYRLYPSKTAILSDIIIDGMHRRNSFYESACRKILSDKGRISPYDVASVIFDGMFIDRETAAIYVEFLINRRHSAELEQLYQQICIQTVRETLSLCSGYGASLDFMVDENMIQGITDLMHSTVLGMVIMDDSGRFAGYRDTFISAFMNILENKKEGYK